MPIDPKAITFCKQSISVISSSFGYDLSKPNQVPDRSIAGLTRAYLSILLQMEEQMIMRAPSFLLLKILTITPLFILHSDDMKIKILNSGYIASKFYTCGLLTISEIMDNYETVSSNSPLICSEKSFKDQVLFYLNEMINRFSYESLCMIFGEKDKLCASPLKHLKAVEDFYFRKVSWTNKIHNTLAEVNSLL
jgi:hypothetical protein